MNRKNTLTALAVGTALGLGACTSTAPVASLTPTPVATTRTPTPTPTPSPTVGEDPVVAAIKATIIGYHKDEAYLMQHPEEMNMARIQKWSTGKNLFESVRGVFLTRELGRQEGDPVIRDIQVFAPPVDKGAGLEITAVYCSDATAVKFVKPDGSSMPSAIPTLENTVLLRFVDGQWLIDTLRNADAKGVKTC